jgi:Leucine-rich repeat (LRR) protein
VSHFFFLINSILCYAVLSCALLCFVGAGNEFSGHLPPSLSTLQKLTSMRLYQNRLSGDIGQHTIFGACLPSLVHVDISDNRLSGTLDTLMNCTKLRRLIAHHNQFKGEIPASVSQLQDLEVLYLHNNRLTGSVPPQLCLLTTHLRLVNLSNNLLSGVIPHDIGRRFMILLMDCSGSNCDSALALHNFRQLDSA